MKATQKGIFFGWYVVVAGAAILFCIQGARATFGVVLKPIIAEMGWSRSAISGAAFLNMTVFALSLTGVGKIYDRYGAKWVVVGSTICVVVGYLSLAHISTYWQFLGLYGVVTALGFGGTSIPLFAALASRWFHRHRGLVISIVLAGGCLGQYVVVPVVTDLVFHHGWRTTFIIIGLIILIVNLALALTCIRSDPAKMGLSPYGSKIPPNWRAASQPTAPDDLKRVDADLRHAARTSSFWFYLMLMIVCGGGDFLFLTHLIPMVTDYGVSPAVAGHMLGWAGLMSLAGVLITGPLTDRIGNKIPLIITFALRTGIFVLILRYQSVLAFYLFALSFGFTMLITAPITTTLLGRLYGFTHVGIITGFITTMHHLSGGVWAYLGGMVFDRTGNYRGVFFFSALLASVALLCALGVKEKYHGAHSGE